MEVCATHFELQVDDCTCCMDDVEVEWSFRVTRCIACLLAGPRRAPLSHFPFLLCPTSPSPLPSLRITRTALYYAMTWHSPWTGFGIACYSTRGALF